MDRENPRFDDMQKYALSAEKKREVLKKKFAMISANITGHL